MPEIKRGDIYWANLNPTIGSEINKIRPVVILSLTPINKARNTVIVAPLSTSAPEIKHINVKLTAGNIARCDQIRTLDKSRLSKKIGSMHTKDITLIIDNIKYIIGF